MSPSLRESSVLGPFRRAKGDTDSSHVSKPRCAPLIALLSQFPKRRLFMHGRCNPLPLGGNGAVSHDAQFEINGGEKP